MKKLLLSSAAFVAFGATSFAADLPAPMAMVEPLPVASVANWSGVYLGLQGGGLFGGGRDELDCGDDGGVGLATATLETFPGLAVSDPTDGGVDPIGDDTATIAYGAACDDLDFENSNDDFSWVGGAHIGADAQFGHFVIGAVLDAQWVGNISNEDGFALDPDSLVGGVNDLYSIWGVLEGFPDVWTISEPDFDASEAGAPYQAFSFEDELKWYGTGRIRAGVAVGERVLIYGTGGISFGEVESSASRVAVFTGDEADRYFANQGGAPAFDDEYAPGGPLPAGCTEIVATDTGFGAGGDGDLDNATGVVCRESSSSDDFRVGYALGAGIEFLATQNFSLGVEAMYVDLGDGDFEFDFGDSDVDFATVMLKASYRFGGGS